MYRSTPASQSTGFQFGSTTPAAPAQSGGFGLPSASTNPSTGFNFGSTSTPAAPASTGFSFGTPASAAAPPSTGFGLGSQPSASATSLFTSSVPAQTATGMPYPKDTKFADLPKDVQTAIETLEKTIRGYETASFQVTNRRYEPVSSCAAMIRELEGKLHVFEFAIQQNQNRMVAAKRNLGKYWKYGEAVARHISSTKGTAASAEAQYFLPPSDFKFLETILADFQYRASELETISANIKHLLDGLRLQPAFSVQSLRETIRCHSEALVALSEKMASFHDDVRALRELYRNFCVVYRHDSRDPFAAKQATPSVEPHKPAAAPSLSGMLGHGSSTFGTNPLPSSAQPPAANAFRAPSVLGLPSANAFMNK